MASNFWEKLKKPIMVIAPMSGVTDEAFRLMFLKYGKPDVFWTEFISASALCSPKGKKYCLNVLKFNKKERPIVAQVFGSNPTEMEKACKIIENLGFDGIDINMGCPDKNIEKQGAGSALIKTPDLAKQIIQSAKKGAKNIPVSVKTRLGYNKNEIKKWLPAILKENVSALTIHFRTRKELYLPPAHWDLAKEVVSLKNKYAPKTIILGNGDVKTLPEAEKLVKQTGVDGVMIGRAVLGNPWFFSQKNPTLSQKLKAIIEHANLLGKEKHWDSIKKHFHAYAKGFRGASKLREKLMKVKNAKETKNVINNFLKLSLFIIFLFSASSCFAKTTENYNLEKIFYLPKYNAVKGVESLEKNWQKIDILAPQYHTITFSRNSSKITGTFGPKLKKVIKENKLKVMPLIANSNFSQSLMHKLLLSEKEQDRVIVGLIYLAKREKYIGWQFDFENISYTDRDLFSAFVERTYKSFKKNNLILSVATITRTVDYENTNAFKNWGGVFDYKRIASSSDFISLMAYDDPNSVGPVASIDFINGVLEYMKDKIPPEKLSLGVPLYYWKWDADENKKIGSGFFNNVATIISNYLNTVIFNKDLGVSCLSYAYNNKNYKIWFEDKNSLEAKLAIVKDNKFRGFSAWLLGGEDPAIWSLF